MKSKLILVLLIGLILRIYGIYWDQGFHLHPDERMIIMVAEKINFFNQLNPDFFNYGSLPIYLLKGVAQITGLIFPHLPNYDGMLTVGRLLSIFFDLINIFLVYLISDRLFNRKDTGLYSAFFYSILFFPIQNSHFYTVDTLLTTLTTLLLLAILKTSTNKENQPTLMNYILLGVVLGAIMATKFTGILFVPITILSILLIYLNFKKKQNFVKTALLITLMLISFFASFFIFMPYAFINYGKFLNDIILQLKMNQDPYIFPYTLQYVSTLPYLYYLKNMIVWGIGPIAGILAIWGLLKVLFMLANYFLVKKSHNILPTVLLVLFYLAYFVIIGKSAVKFMRYMLPLYPLAGILIGYAFVSIKNNMIKTGLLILSFIWTLMFVNIYSTTNTRITATNWIIKNIPVGSKIAVEHWDDRLPLMYSSMYIINELELYDQPDNNDKWQKINSILNETQYIIIASNRLYAPLQKLTDCKLFEKCYPKTNKYYKNLFADKLGFKKAIEFTNHPRIEIGNLKWEIDDSWADESFTVYDHPKILIYQKNGLDKK